MSMSMVQLVPGASAKPGSGAISQKLAILAMARPPEIAAPSAIRAGPDSPSRKSCRVSPLWLERISR